MVASLRSTRSVAKGVLRYPMEHSEENRERRRCVSIKAAISVRNGTNTAGANRTKTCFPRIFSVQRSLRNVKLGSMSDRFEGSCLCGAVRFVATGQPESVVWCHCESCRKHSGAPVSVFVAFKRDAYVVNEGQITKFNSSPGRWRGFCAKCGSTLTCEGERSNETHFHIGAFRNAAQFQPTRHIFPEERLPWLHLRDA